MSSTTLANCIRIEFNENNDDLFLVFKVIDSKFKQEVKKDWLADIELVILGKDLIRNEKN